MDTGRFFEELYGDAVDESNKMYIWSPKTGSKFFASTKDAATFAAPIQDRDVYFGLGLTKLDLPKEKRPTNLQVSAIPGLWLDVDIAGPAHKKENLPTTIQDGLDLITANIPHKPSLIVQSGHGLHAYWVFKEPWVFEREEDRIQAAIMLKNFVQSFKYHAAVRGWTMDSVFDLARVFRVPGTMNCKAASNKIPCIVMQETSSRYNPEDFDEYLLDMSHLSNDDTISEILSKDKNPFELTLRVDASPDKDRIETICTIDNKFEALWNRKRKDLKDQSLSSYEMGIANMLVSYGWEPKEIADCMISFRRRFGKNQKEINKGMRIDYITRTILKAQSSVQKIEATPDILKLAKTVGEVTRGETTAPPPTSDEIRAALEGVLQVKIDRIVKYACDNPIYEMILQDGTEIPIGTIDKLITQRMLKNILASHRGVIIRTVKSALWDEYATLLMQLVETVVPLAEDTTDKGILGSSIVHYLEKIGVLDDVESAFHSGRPFVSGGKVYLFSKHFVNWLKFNSEPMSLKSFSMTARSMGIDTVNMKFRFKESSNPVDTTKSVYNVTRFAEKIVNMDFVEGYRVEEASSLYVIQ